MNSCTRRHFTALSGTALALPALFASRAALAQGSDKPLRIILPIGAGSGVDTAARPMAAALSAALGRPVVMENLPGAGGITGTQQIVRAPKDGSVIGIVSINHAVNPAVYKSMPYDSLADITPITVVGALPFVLLVNSSVPVKNVQELIAMARAKPGDMTYASSGNGTIIHLAMEMLLSQANIKARHIPYKSTGQMVTDMIGGQVQMGFVAISVALPHMKSGSLRALGVSTPSRSPLAPEVPTIAEQGLPNYAVEGWFAAVAPAGVPAAEINRLSAAFKAALAKPEVRDALLAQGYILNGSSPESATRYFASESARLAKIVKDADIKID